MWGNSTGWFLSAGLSLIMGWMMWMVVAPPTPTPPTGASVFAVAQKKIALSESPDTVATPGTQDADAGVLYRKAIDDYLLSSRTYETFKDRPMTVKPKELTAVEYVLKARDCAKFKLFAEKPSELVNYENSEPSIDALFEVGNICCTLGKLYTLETYDKNTKPDEARKLWEAAFILGARMYEERVCWLELADGHGLMQAAGVNLKNYYRTIKKDPAKLEAITSFLEAEDSYKVKIMEAVKIVSGIDEPSLGRYAGDIFAIAQNPQADRMFRVEALKHIGNYRFNATTQGDQLGARKVLNKVLADPSLDPAVKAAAEAAHELTLAGHNKFG